MLSGNPNGHKVMYTLFRHIAGLTLPTPLPLLCLSRQSFHEIDTGRDDKNNGGGVVWGISRYYFHFYMIHNFLTDCETAFNSIDKDHWNTIPYEHCFRLILIDAKRKKNLFRSIDIDRNKRACAAS